VLLSADQVTKRAPAQLHPCLREYSLLYYGLYSGVTITVPSSNTSLVGLHTPLGYNTIRYDWSLTSCNHLLVCVQCSQVDYVRVCFRFYVL